MTVFLIAEVRVTDDAWIPDYAARVHDIAAQYNGRYLSRSGNIETLEGTPTDQTLIALIQFPSRDYAPFAAARKTGSVSHFRLIDDTDLAGAIPYLGKPG